MESNLRSITSITSTITGITVSEDFEVNPTESPDQEAGAGDAWGVAGAEVDGADPGDNDDSLERGRPRQSPTPTPAAAAQRPPSTRRHQIGISEACGPTWP